MVNFKIKSICGSLFGQIFSAKPIQESKKVVTKTGRIYLVAIAANISVIAIGTCFSWSSPVGQKLLSQDTSDSPLDRPISSLENAWISSIFTIGALMTPFIAGPLADKIGRKKVLLLSSLFFILGYVFLLVAKEVWTLLVGRIILGFGIGFAMCIIPMYVGEISTDETRGATGSFMPFSISFGLCYGYCIGPFVSYFVLQYCCLLVPILFDVVFIFMPESPYYSLAKGQREAASKALQFLRGQDEQGVEAELLLMENLITNSKLKKTGILEIVKTSANRKALLISVGLIFFQQISGLNVLVCYAQTIFESADIALDAAIAAIIVGFVQAIAAGFAPVVVKKFGRKDILLYSTSLMSISLAALGYFFYAQIVSHDTSGIGWLPVTSMVLFNIAFGLGFGPVPWAVLSEIFAPNTKAIATAIATSVNLLTRFLAVLFYPVLDELGTYYAFWLLTIFCVLAFLFIFFIVVETKDLSFAEIQDKLNKKI